MGQTRNILGETGMPTDSRLKCKRTIEVKAKGTDPSFVFAAFLASLTCRAKCLKAQLKKARRKHFRSCGVCVALAGGSRSKRARNHKMECWPPTQNGISFDAVACDSSAFPVREQLPATNLPNFAAIQKCVAPAGPDNSEGYHPARAQA